MSPLDSEQLIGKPGGVLVVRRWNVDAANGLRTRAAKIGIDQNWVEKQYRGIDGDVWPELSESDGIDLIDGLASLDQLASVRAYYNRLSSGPTYDIIYCQFTVPPDWKQPQPFTFCGYDYGYYESEWSNYSVLFNEVIYGLYSDMHQYYNVLNQYLLLPSYESVSELERTRNDLIAAGSDLEEGICKAIGIYAVPITEKYKR